MTRTLRHEYEGAVYHAMCRGNDGQQIFREEKGYRLFLSTLEEVCLQTGWRIHAYVLMNNHYHLLLETPEANLVAGMKWFQGTYTQRFNSMFKRRGHLFQGRYKALPIDPEKSDTYFREVGQYIHLNPYRAKLAGTGMDQPLEGFGWSSYPAYIGVIGKYPEWLVCNRLYGAFDLGDDRKSCQENYKLLVESRMLGEADQLEDSTRMVIEKQIRRGWYIGGDAFRGQLAGMITSRSDNLRGEQRLAHNEMEANRLIAEALKGFGIDEPDLISKKSAVLEKRAIAWMLKRYTTVTVVWIADRLKMGHRTNASKAIATFEKENSVEIEQLKAKVLRITG